MKLAVLLGVLAICAVAVTAVSAAVEETEVEAVELLTARTVPRKAKAKTRVSPKRKPTGKLSGRGVNKVPSKPSGKLTGKGVNKRKSAGTLSGNGKPNKKPSGKLSGNGKVNKAVPKRSGKLTGQGVNKVPKKQSPKQTGKLTGHGVNKLPNKKKQSGKLTGNGAVNKVTPKHKLTGKLTGSGVNKVAPKQKHKQKLTGKLTGSGVNKVPAKHKLTGSLTGNGKVNKLPGKGKGKEKGKEKGKGKDDKNKKFLMKGGKPPPKSNIPCKGPNNEPGTCLIGGGACGDGFATGHSDAFTAGPDRDGKPIGPCTCCYETGAKAHTKPDAVDPEKVEAAKGNLTPAQQKYMDDLKQLRKDNSGCVFGNIHTMTTAAGTCVDDTDAEKRACKEVITAKCGAGKVCCRK